ncbi:lysylphosphatidylglycerol synthase domain-containing protein [Hyunsoonleella aquatilis]|uniref:lysylphosphatidylglycerol synthase domain-containing protein n=1 Tax=Hyunsoonleella aquatilis TaxID=2762758 RepID=UPI0031B5D04F
MLIKLSIVGGAIYFVYQKLTDNPDLNLSEFIVFARENKVLSSKNALILVLLSILNWCFEILKWKYLTSPVARLNFKQAMEQSLGALTASLFTPNRIGEYGAKAIYFEGSKRKSILMVNLLGNILQMGITVIFGIIGLSFFMNRYHLEIDFYRFGRLLIIFFLAIALVGFGIRKSEFSIKGFSFEKVKQFVLNYPKNGLSLGVLFSLFRYLIFSFQFFLLLHIFNTDLAYFEAMMVITSLYLLASLLPSIFIFDAVIKGGVAVYLFSFLGINPLIILSTVTIMWLLNFALPSVFGSYYVLNFNLPKSE